ncbi:uncharacterized protein FFB14_13561 [Fusarium fujikuroi]|nr:uncharacterized protein FFB14_13561 [Fusarium fujikuroi]
MKFAALDISKDLAEQGFAGCKYDLTLATNVIHATKSLNESLKNVRQLLGPNGRFLLHKLTPISKGVNYVWGTLAGWWHGEQDGRPDEPYISIQRILWITHLSQLRCSGPRFGQVLGISRTLRSEMPLDFATCEADDIQSSSDRIIDVFGRFQLRQENGTLKPDYEYSVIENTVYVGLMHPFSAQANLLVPSEDEPVPLRTSKPGRLDALHWAGYQAPGLKDDDVEIQVQAAGLNFKDVLCAMGIIEYFMFISHSEFSTQVIVSENLCEKIPDNLSFEDAATMPCVFATSAGTQQKHLDLAQELDSYGCLVDSVQGSINSLDDVTVAVSRANGHLKGILQMSMVLCDQSFDEMTIKDWNPVVNPKVKGIWNLHNASLSVNAELDFFILFSSLSGVIGQPGQANYAGANTFLDSFSQYRAHLGLPACAIQIGAVEEVGYMAEHQVIMQKLKASGGSDGTV